MLRALPSLIQPFYSMFLVGPLGVCGCIGRVCGGVGGMLNGVDVVEPAASK